MSELDSKFSKVPATSFSSPYASGLMLAHKKDRGLRVCMYYSKDIVPDSLLCIDYLADPHACQMQWYNVYHSRLNEELSSHFKYPESKEKTAYICHMRRSHS